MNFNALQAFSKEFKGLSKKYKSLNNDLIEFKKIVSLLPMGNGRHFNIITQSHSIKIVKARFFCRYLRGSSLRIIYAYYPDKNFIEFIELYFKGRKPNEDKARIRAYLENRS